MSLLKDILKVRSLGKEPIGQHGSVWQDSFGKFHFEPEKDFTMTEYFGRRVDLSHNHPTIYYMLRKLKII